MAGGWKSNGAAGQAVCPGGGWGARARAPLDGDHLPRPAPQAHQRERSQRARPYLASGRTHCLSVMPVMPVLASG
jgi:hypothetical protein